MSYLEELLPEFRKGAKIRCSDWDKERFICYNGYVICDENGYPIFKEVSDWTDVLLSDKWELYQEPIDWQYIIDSKCLCWFWDYNESKKHIGILKSINKYETYKFSIVTPDNYVSDISFVNCRPVRRDEVTFYEEKKDDFK